MADRNGRTVVIVLLASLASVLASIIMYSIAGYDRAVTAAYGGVCGVFLFLFALNVLGLIYADRSKVSSVAFLETLGKTALYGYMVIYAGWWFFYKILAKPDWMQNRQLVFLTIAFAAGVIIFGALMTDRAGGILPKAWLIGAAVVATTIASAAAFAALFGT